MANIRKTGTTVLKIVLSLVLLYFVYTKIDLGELKAILGKGHLAYLALATLFFVFSKILAAFRLYLYFKELKIALSQYNNLKLYALGMFYNLFLPGGIGGDAYKAYRIKKDFGTPLKKVLAVLLLDRLSGLLLLFVFACLLLFGLQLPPLKDYNFIWLLLVPLALYLFWLLATRFFSYVQAVFWQSLGFSAGVQVAQLICVYNILLALDIQVQQASYLLVFLVSSIVSVLPLTIGGIGSREITFFYGADLLMLDENKSIAISVSFFMITALVSFLGIYYHFKKIEFDPLVEES